MKNIFSASTIGTLPILQECPWSHVTNADQDMGGEKKERKAKHPWLENWLQLVT